MRIENMSNIEKRIHFVLLSTIKRLYDLRYMFELLMLLFLDQLILLENIILKFRNMTI